MQLTWVSRRPVWALSEWRRWIVGRLDRSGRLGLGRPGRQILGHGPSEGNEIVATFAVERCEEGRDLGRNAVGLGRFDVQRAGGAGVARHDAGASVGAPLW